MSSRPEQVASDGQAMLDLARLAITEAVVHKSVPNHLPNEGVFSQHRGVFVTLCVKEKLRGCIGVVEGHGPLGENIVQSAVSAAMHDPRFAPVRADELSDLQIEISLLSPLVPMSAEEIRIGTHGLLIVCGQRRGLLLPQVATEHGLSREQFLDETCRKAGLPFGAWKDAAAAIFGFTCEIHSELHGFKGGG
ncbi:MAG TPA: AmmeMemoRadiSam system protein A [Terriglobales bacterium]|nr:AmmeMemoRadiSam system protein A [Terriglobales bacterium]